MVAEGVTVAVVVLAFVAQGSSTTGVVIGVVVFVLFEAFAVATGATEKGVVDLDSTDSRKPAK